MSRIDELFQSVKGARAALIGYTTAGFPDYHDSLAIASSLLDSCDALELGIPFSDPTMDGPIIQESSHLSLEAGTRVSDVITLAGELRDKTEKPLIIMSYYNPINSFGAAAFAREAALAGVDGVLLPDLPLEEISHWKVHGDRAGIDTMLFASSTTPPHRLERLGEMTNGFLYCLAVKGTTGLREGLSEDAFEFMRRARESCKVPLALGVGISNAEQCRLAAGVSDAVIVGSALVKEALDAFRSGGDPSRSAGRKAAEFARSLS
ncbi:MAG: tryptophan synthase subunit alpha [Candidatus Solincola sediminis]|uniref:Tryptophan synthase alpha chain n=1 Tax=Candidatus Solincola sediminis TaxID=1797199 RepID=A0A1F2WK70_9ACTN|nr:MAG: tryptophan synthase subunit alpha [Candidatus Solincola sediminis]